MIQRKKRRTRFMIKGDFEQMIQFLRDTNKLIRGQIVIVQPSICASVELSDKYAEVLGATSDFITRAGKVNQFLIMGSK